MDGVYREVKLLLRDFAATRRGGIELRRAILKSGGMRAICLLLIQAALAAAPETVVPKVAGGAMRADGRLEAHEWDGAESVPLTDGGILRVKQVQGRLWLAIAPEARHATYVDLFLQTEDGVVHNLHASLQWGERIVSGNKWTDTTPATAWGPPAHWRANRIEYAPGGRDAAEATRANFKPYEAHEYGISRQKFRGRTWRIRLEVRDFAGKEPDRIFPAASSRYDPRGWWTLRLE